MKETKNNVDVIKKRRSNIEEIRKISFNYNKCITYYISNNI